MASRINLPSEAAGWKWDGKDARYNPRTLFQYIDGAAELYLSYGFQSLVVRRFEKPGQPSIALELYEMASSEDACGVFSFEHQDETVGLGQESEFGGGLLRLWKGKYFVSAYAEGDSPEVGPAILSLGRSTVAGILPGPAPKVLEYLPDKSYGLVDRSTRYLRSHVLLNQRFFVSHQNILLLNRESEAVLATYLRNSYKLHLLLLHYPNEAKAGEAWQSFSQAYMPDAAGKGRVKTEDGKWTMVRKNKEYILVVFGAPREGEAESLLKAAEQKILSTAK